MPLIGTKAILVARDSLALSLVQLVLDAARERYASQGFFEEPAEFPNTMFLDTPVSVDAMRHLRFGPKMLQRYMPLVAASYLERVFVLLVPLVVVLLPQQRFCRKVFKTIVMRCTHSFYGELAMLAREVDTATDKAATARWLVTLGTIERSTGSMKVSTSFGNEVYALREHIKFVHRDVMAKAEEQTNDSYAGYGDSPMSGCT